MTQNIKCSQPIQTLTNEQIHLPLDQSFYFKFKLIILLPKFWLNQYNWKCVSKYDNFELKLIKLFDKLYEKKILLECFVDPK